jgi:hypothetical protein
MKIEGEQRHLEEFLLSKEWLKNFKISKLVEKKNEYNIELEEKKENIPKAAKKGEVIAKGFVNTVEILHFAVWGKPLYIKFKRRRWRDKKSKKDYVNEYDLHPQGAKISYALADYIKKNDRTTLLLLFGGREHVRHLPKENISMVSRFVKWLYNRKKSKGATRK